MTLNNTTPAGSTRWYVCVTYRGQRYREVAGDTKQAALKRLRELEDRLDKVGDLTPKRVPFDFLCDEYMKWVVNLAPRTRIEREYITRVHLKKFFNGLVRDIDTRSIEAYKASRLSIPIAPITLNTHMKTMGHADIKTTMIYVSLGKSHIREHMNPTSYDGERLPEDNH